MVNSTTLRKAELRLFISSTFRDLHEEREYLIKKVFPELRTLCRSRGVTFTEVDLRWGLTDEEHRLGHIIRTCLEEIDRCRPYFIGIIGSEYGWVPEYHEVMMDPVMQDLYPWCDILSLNGASLLEMEFTHGVLNGNAESALLYKRIGKPINPDTSGRLEQLVERIAENGRPFKMFQSPEQLGEFVRADLLEQIERMWPKASVPSVLESERMAHEAFAHSRRQAYIPNPEYLATFNKWISQGNTPLIISAESGMGKSSLVAWFAAEYKHQHPSSFLIEHFVGASNDSTDHIGFMRRTMSEIKEHYGLDDDIPLDSDAIEKSFPEWLSRIGKVEGFANETLLIILDAADQFFQYSSSLAWLPMVFPDGIKLIVSMTPSETLDKLLMRDWARLKMRALKVREREAIVIRYLAEYHKALPSHLLQRIGEDEKASSPLFLRTIAEELRLYGKHESLEEAVDHYLSVANLDELFIRILERMENDHGARIVRSVTTTLAASRAGLEESHLLEASGVSRIELSTLLHALDYHLLRNNGKINFFHNYLRKAVEKHYLNDPEVIINAHRTLAAFFMNEFYAAPHEAEKTHDSTLIREMLYQYFMSENKEALQSALLSPVVFDMMFADETEYEFLRYWKSLGELHLADLYENSFQIETDAALSNTLRIDRYLKLFRLYKTIGSWDAAENKLKDAILWCEKSGDSLRMLLCWGALGDLLVLSGRFPEALAAYKKKLAFAQALNSEDLAAIAEGDIGQVLLERGEYDEAMDKFNAMLNLCRTHNNKRGVTRALVKIGQIHFNKGNYDSAMNSFRSCIEFLESLGDRREIAFTLGQIGLIYWNTGEFEKAMNCFTEERESMGSIGDSLGYAAAIGKIGLVSLDSGDIESASQSFTEYLKITKNLGYLRGMGFAYGDIGIVCLRRNEFGKAMEYFDLAIAIHQEIDFPYGIALWLRWKAEALLELVMCGECPIGQLPDALEWNMKSTKIAKNIGYKEIFSEAEILHARLLYKLGDYNGSGELLLKKIMEEQEDSKRAELHYWIWKLFGSDKRKVGLYPDFIPLVFEGTDFIKHKESAKQLFQSLCERTKKYSYMQRLEELSR